ALSLAIPPQLSAEKGIGSALIVLLDDTFPELLDDFDFPHDFREWLALTRRALSLPLEAAFEAALFGPADWRSVQSEHVQGALTSEPITKITIQRRDLTTFTLEVAPDSLLRLIGRLMSAAAHLPEDVVSDLDQEDL